MLNTLDLFAGIGGFSLGLERTEGFHTAAFCEIDPAARRVLNKNWPDVPVYEDVTALTKERLDADGIAIDVITGGFPCQDISLAGKGAGLAGTRSGLWFQFHRLIDEVRPDWAIIENVSALRSRGLDVVLGSLAEIGYDAEWHCIPASAVGAPHQRDRIWIVASLADARCGRRCGPQAGEVEQPWGAEALGASEAMAHAESDGRGQGSCVLNNLHPTTGCYWQSQPGRSSDSQHEWWGAEPNVGRVAHGVPGRVDRLKQLGNAVVPNIPELIGLAILAA